MPTPIKNLVGLAQGRLTVLERLTSKKAGSYLYKCSCLCGSTVNYSTAELLHKAWPRKSCGACKAELRFPKEYAAWEAMRDRCFGKDRKTYPNYGGRGITICDSWIKDFFYFLADMGTAPTKYHTLDRKDNNGNYCKENCRWLHISLQNDNTSRNIETKLKEFTNGKLSSSEIATASCGKTGSTSKDKCRSSYQRSGSTNSAIGKLKISELLSPNYRRTAKQ